jgi:1-acyl-sn-glycerol-3-phosphate acyltransferase
MTKTTANPISRPVPLDGAWPWVPRLAGWIWVAWRVTVFALWTLLCAPVQAVLIRLPGRARARLPLLYWAGCCRCLGLRVRVIGTPPSSRLPTVFVSNHSSWIDIPALGSCLPACFIAKGEVGRWPVISIIARLGRTVFVSRRAAGAARENADIARRLRDGDSLILFPEGTTSDGSRVLPFRSSFLSIATAEPQPLVQPVSVVFDRLAGLPTGRATRPIFAYYGDMAIGPHYWRLAQCHGLGASIVLHQPLDPRDYADRKALSQAAWRAVAAGADCLRQNRPAKPAPAPAGEANLS